MIDSRVKDLIKIATLEFSKRASLESYWQELALQFYPERADFVTQRPLGDKFDNGMMTSTPMLARRELCNQLATVLRPAGTPWFQAQVEDEETNEKHAVKQWLDWATETQRRAMYDPVAWFNKAAKQTDHDWGTFGNAVMSIEPNMRAMSLLYRNWHLKDCAWCENDTGEIDTMYRKWVPTARQLVKRFPDTVASDVRRLDEKDPYRAVSCMHITMPIDYVQTDKKYNRRAKFISYYIDIENETMLLEEPLQWFQYVIPRWVTVSGSQYGWSAATGPGLAEARTLQSVMRVVLEAGEKAVDPPMIATQEAVRSDMDVRAGGVTWVDIEYDERLGEALRPISQKLDVPVGIEILDRLERVVADGMFLNKLNLPAEMKNMTAYEVRKRIEEMIRSTMPLFQPAEDDYSAKVCEKTFDILLSLQTFGDPRQWPRELLGQQVKFKFKSPITDLSNEADAQKFIEGTQILTQAAQFDPSLIAAANFDEATIDALRGVGWEEEWLNDPQAIMAKRQEIQQEKTAQTGMATLASAAPAVAAAGTATKAFADAGLA